MRGYLANSTIGLQILLLSVLAVGCDPAPAIAGESLAKQLEAVLDGPDYKHASWGVLVVDSRDGKVVYARNPDTMLAPASVTKIFTCAAALIALGPDHTFETAVYQRGLALKGTLRGDLILVASGDLTLGSRKGSGDRLAFSNVDHTYANGGLGEADSIDADPLAGIETLAKQVKEAGIKKIDGEILIDDRLFARARSSGSGPDVVCPILVNDNVIDLIVEPGSESGSPAKVRTRPESAFYQMDSLMTTGDKGSTTSIQIHAIGPDQFAIRGKIPLDSKPLLRVCPVDDPALFARTLFIEALRRNGVEANAALLRPAQINIPEKDGYGKLKKIANFKSPPFKEMIAVTLKVSHNLYASTLPCLIAASKGHATAEAGLREERKILKELGVDVKAISFGGGAGGAPADHVSPRATVQLLQGMAKRPEWEAFKAGLPLLGVDGTLATVVSSDSPAKGKVAAKTGTLIWYDAANERFLLKSKALAGVMTTKSGTPLVFAIIVNNVPLPDGVNASREGKTLGKLCEILYEQ